MTSKYIKPPPVGSLVWFTGAPPYIGWWPASFMGDTDLLRWWDGTCWSVAASIELSQEEAGRSAAIKERPSNRHIYWAHRWWLTEQERKAVAAGIARAKAIALCRKHAIQCREHSYTGAKVKDDITWAPHEWVINAILEASGAPVPPVQLKPRTPIVCKGE